MNNYKPIVIGWGRLNPITKGHMKMIYKMNEMGSKYNAPAELYLSHSQDRLRNPLSYSSKVFWTQRAAKDLVEVIDTPERTVFDVLKRLSAEGYTDVIYVGGGDRIGGEEDISNQILKYNGKPSKTGEIPYNFNSIEFVSAGDRNPDSNDIAEKASATAARAAVVSGNFETFSKLVPFDTTDAENLFKELYSIMVGEEVDECLNRVDEGFGTEYRSKIITIGDKMITESLEAVGSLEVGGQSFKIKAYNNQYLLMMGEDRFLDDFSRIFKGSIELNLPSENINAKAFNYVGGSDALEEGEYKIAGGSRGSNGRVHGRLVVNNNGKLIKLDGRRGNVNGPSTGEYVEALVCYFYNSKTTAKKDTAFSADQSALPEHWVESINKTVESISERWSPDDYIAYHVDGRDINPPNSENKDIAEIFKNKFMAGKNILGAPSAFKDLYFGGKDNWCKADIILVKKGETITSLFEGVSTSAELNSRIYHLCNPNGPQSLIPISLKKVGPSPKISFSSESFVNVDSDVAIQLPTRVSKNSVNCNCYLKTLGNNTRVIEFRTAATGENNLNVEVLYRGARGGKPLQRIKNELKIQGKGYLYPKISSAEELISLLEQISPNIVGTVPPKGASEEDTKPWYTRTCFRGLIGIYQRYVDFMAETQGRENVNPREFFSWIYNLSTQTPAPFYLLK